MNSHYIFRLNKKHVKKDPKKTKKKPNNNSNNQVKHVNALKIE